MKNMVRVSYFVALSVMMAAQPSAAQDGDSSGTTTIWDGVYTMQQAERGQRLSQQECLICHAPSEWTTPTFLRMWQDRSLLGLYDMIRLTMPVDLPGRFTREEYADIIAYILRLNDLPEGTKPLPGEQERLELIMVTAEEAEPEP